MHPISRTSIPASTAASAAFAPAPPTRIAACSVSSVPPGAGRSVTGLITMSACTHPMTVTVETRPSRLNAVHSPAAARRLCKDLALSPHPTPILPCHRCHRIRKGSNLNAPSTGATTAPAGPAGRTRLASEPVAGARRAGGARDDLPPRPDHAARDRGGDQPFEADGIGRGQPARAGRARPRGRQARRPARTQAGRVRGQRPGGLCRRRRHRREQCARRRGRPVRRADLRSEATDRQGRKPGRRRRRSSRWSAR